MQKTRLLTKLPLYVQIRQDLLARIAEGEWKPGEKLPRELDLCKEYGVSLGTLRRATESLAADEILSRKEGSGTFVKTYQWGGYWNAFQIYKGMNGKRRGHVCRLAVFEHAEADPETAGKLAVPEGEPMIRLVRHWFEAGSLVSACESFLVERFFPGMQASDFTEKYLPEDSFYRFLEREYGTLVVSQRCEVRYEEIGPELAARLQVSLPFNVLRTECVSLDFQRRPVELRINRGLATNTKVCFDIR